jgi:hypothetical protein
MSMYQHRGVPPSQVRLTELLDQIREEFNNQIRLNENYEQQSESFPIDDQVSVCLSPEAVRLMRLSSALAAPGRVNIPC